MTKALFFLIMGLGVILEVGGDVFFKKWANGDRRLWLIVGFLLYSLGSIGWAWSLKYESLSKAVTIFMVANVALAILAGHVLFGERLSAWNWIGVGLAGLAIVLCEL